MRKELDNKLYKTYPKIFKNKISIACGNGWFFILNSLCSQLQFDIKKNNEPQIVFTTVKEKFGSLRVYVEKATERQYSMIDIICFMSNYICEDCGSTKNIKQSKGYIRSLCTDCMIKYKEEIDNDR